MTRRCKPGQRARITIGTVDKGKIVLVVRSYRPGEKINDAGWPEALYPWVVTTLSGPLGWQRIDNPNIAGTAFTIVMCDSHLEPLDDDDDGLGRDTDVSKPKERPAVLVKPTPKGVVA